MTLLMTLLTLFLGGRPTAAVPPEPAPTHVSVGWNLSFETRTSDSLLTTPEDPFGVPLVTSMVRHSSPSLMVAAPPEGYSAPFNVFAPAVRPPHEFPTLYPCDSVTLVPCPPPLPAYDPPAVRHVSFTGEGAEFRIAQAQAECEAGTCPQALDHACQVRGSQMADQTRWIQPHHIFTHRVLGLGPHGLWDQLHARQHAPEHHNHATLACEAAQACPLAGAPVICPLGFGGPLNAPAFVVAAQNENHPGCPVALPGHPFPGAKSVQHVVSATYDVPNSSAKALVQILEKSNGVFGCKVEGDELTVNATPPAQMAIATFLCTIVNEEQTVSQPAKTISVRHTEIKSCPAECSEAKACPTECSATKACPTECLEAKCSKENSRVGLALGALCGTVAAEAKCCSECGEKCNCCKCGKTKPVTSEPTACKTSEKGLFNFYVGLTDCKACPPAATKPVAIHVEATEAKPVIVKIQATPDGVLLQTSDGTQVRAQSIQLETHGVDRLHVEHAAAVHTQPKTAPKPPTAAKHPVSTY